MAHRDTKGRFLTGNGASKGFGRPMEKYKRSLQEALANEYPPDVIIELLNESIEIARRTNAAKGILNIVTEILDRTVGPAVRVETPPESDAMSEMIEQWRIAKQMILDERARVAEEG